MVETAPIFVGDVVWMRPFLQQTADQCKFWVVFFCDGKTPQWQSGRLGSAASGGSSDRSGSRLVCRLIELSRAPKVIIYLCMNEHITQNTAMYTTREHQFD